ncbi:hypothetical protein [Methylobacterium oxalidis]|nr:hypothetical protein [Methylobacterium oxalidis]
MPEQEQPADLLPAPSYDRDARMSRLLQAGETAAKPICSGC